MLSFSGLVQVLASDLDFNPPPRNSISDGATQHIWRAKQVAKRLGLEYDKRV